MKRRIAKRVTTVWRRIRTAGGWRREDGPGRPFLVPHSWNRVRRFYSRYSIAQWADQEPLGRRAVVARRKPRAGRKRS